MFGNWNTAFKRFRHWVKADVFKRIFDAVSGEPDMEYAMIDGTVVAVLRSPWDHGFKKRGTHAAEARSALTSPRAGWPGSKSLAPISIALADLVDFELLP